MMGVGVGVGVGVSVSVSVGVGTLRRCDFCDEFCLHCGECRLPCDKW